MSDKSSKVRIQILDVKTTTGSNLVDLSNSTSPVGRFAPGIPFAWHIHSNGTYAQPMYGQQGGGTFNLTDIIDSNYNGGLLISGKSYRVEFRVERYTEPFIFHNCVSEGGSYDCLGYIGMANAGGISNSAKLNANGTYSEIFTSDGTQVKLMSDDPSTGNPAGPVIPTRIFCNITEVPEDMGNNVIGELDITNSEDFPLSITYAISDGNDIESKFGDYSKSFDVPATKNNNRLLEHVGNAQVVDSKQMYGLKKCRILVGEIEFFNGMIQVGGVTQQSSIDSYSCTVFGGNYSWLSQIKTLNLCNIYDSNYYLDYNYDKIDSIMEYSRYSGNPIGSNPPIIYPYTYPLISYGDFNPNGSSGIVNLYDPTNPSQDWRPAFWIHMMIEKIFDNIGYTIESDFMNNADNEFKRLVTCFPLERLELDTEGETVVTMKQWNQDAIDSRGIYGIWDAAVASKNYQIIHAPQAFTQGSTGAYKGDGEGVWHDIVMDTTLKDMNANYDDTTGVWTSSTYGFFDVSTEVHLLIGNFDNSNASNTVQTSANNACQVSCRLIAHDDSGVQQYVAGDSWSGNSDYTKIDGYTQLGKKPPSVNSPCYPNSQSPILISCKRAMVSPNAWYMKPNWTIKVQVQVRFKDLNNGNYEQNPNNCKWGMISLADPWLDANSGFDTTVVPSAGYAMYFFEGTNYYTTGSTGTNGLIWANSPGSKQSTNDSKNIKEGWEYQQLPSFKVTPSQPELSLNIGNRYYLEDLLPCSISQTDFLKGISHLFNLQFRTDPQTKKVFIEPYNEFYKSKSLAYDWSGKVDYSQDIKDSFTIGLNEEISFEYKTDGADGLMKFINESFKSEGAQNYFFNYYETLGTQFAKGLRSFKNTVFASTWTDWDADCSGSSGANPKLIPIINKSLSVFGYGVVSHPTRPAKIDKYLPRILKFKGWEKGDNHANFMTKWNWREDLTGSGLQSRGSSYSPRATFVDWESTSTERFGNLSFNNEVINPPATSTYTEVKGLYDIYWKKMIDQLKQNPRTRSYFINLTMNDILTLDLSRLVYIDGVYWKINKIIDFSPSAKELTKVEFIQWSDAPEENNKDI